MTDYNLAPMVAAALLAATLLAAPQEPFAFAVVGDVPYNSIETRLFRDLLAALDRESVEFVVHVGDIKAGAAPCTDDTLEGRRALLDRSAHPLVLLFGDNEWSDCHRASAGAFDPLDRLARLRELFGTGESLGQRRLVFERQSAAYPENVRWRHGAVWFVGLHVVGSGNNRGRNAEMDREYAGRTAANLAWLGDSFARAKKEQAAGVVVLFHGDPRFEARRGSPARAGFDDTIAALEAEVRRFPGPVALVHGDTHRFRIDHPLEDPATGRALERFTRVVTFGSPNVRWVLGRVDPAGPALIRFEAGPDRPWREPRDAAAPPAGRPSARPRKRRRPARPSAGSKRC